MLGVYADFCREFLAMPVIPGIKSASERFAGAVETYCIEAMMQNGWALQAGTSHFLGQNFAKAFDVTFQDEAGVRDHVWATSWGVSTRLVGAVIMTHSDDTGLVLPPSLAPIQVVVVPIWKSEEEKALTVAHAEKAAAALGAAGLRVKVDARDSMKPGAKYFEWERKGVPLRLEVGPRDVASDAVFAAARTGGKKFGIPMAGLVDAVQARLVELHAELYQRALERREANSFRISSYEELRARVDQGGFFLVNWHDDAEAEARIKEETRATIRCFPLDAGPPTGPCFYSGRPANRVAIFARAY